MKHFTATREGTDKRNSNGQTGQGEHCLLDVWLSEYIQHITLQRLNPGRKKENVYCWLFFPRRKCYLN